MTIVRDDGIDPKLFRLRSNEAVLKVGLIGHEGRTCMVATEVQRSEDHEQPTDGSLCFDVAPPPPTE